MNRALGVALIVGGIVLAIYGINATESFSSDVSKFFTGTPTEKSMWLLLGGIAMAIVGSVLSMRPSARALT